MLAIPRADSMAKVQFARCIRTCSCNWPDRAVISAGQCGRHSNAFRSGRGLRRYLASNPQRLACELGPGPAHARRAGARHPNRFRLDRRGQHWQGRPWRRGGSGGGIGARGEPTAVSGRAGWCRSGVRHRHLPKAAPLSCQLGNIPQVLLANHQRSAQVQDVRRLGSGGMGDVYLARHPRLPRNDALTVRWSAPVASPENR